MFKQITSSNLDAARYDADSQTLTVRFKNGTSYRYDGVPAEVNSKFEETFGEDGSAGRFFAQNIRGSFAYKKLED